MYNTNYFPEFNGNISVDVLEAGCDEMSVELPDDMMFSKKITNDLETIKQRFGIPEQNMSFYNDLSMVVLHSNSPIMSVHSDSDSDDDFCPTNKIVYREHYKKVTYEDVERSLEKYYDSDKLYSSELDILTTYMKGQKNIYSQAKHLCQRKLNCLMFPSLFFSAFVTIIGPFVDCNPWSTAFTAGLNAIVALFISMINYLKFESAIEVYLQAANNYDKLQTTLELMHSKLMFMTNDTEKSRLVLDKFGEIENKITEMKLSNTILLPEEIKALFPIICHINIFSFIKKNEIYKKELIEKLCDISNEIQYILYKWKTNPCYDASSSNILNEKTRLVYLYENKRKIKSELIHFRSTYGILDDIFTKEIKYAEENQNQWFFCCVIVPKKNRYCDLLKDANPVIMKYYKTLLDE